ncbi:serine hydrolase [Pedobacter sp. SYP-B3415]|uniref:serine hydrolase n=1 Tax=Pedobacter sp. SYP-B3415 TaxID=2496641 RepID=UPI00101C66CE|nr:serine hydrolase [Pedobacter sp. SYP-B3415]
MKHTRTIRSAALMIISLLISVNINAQTSRAAHDSAAYQIQAYYNAGKPDKIYEMTSDVFRTRMTGEQFSAGMNKYAAKNGKWKSVDFLSENEKGKDYKAIFEQSEQMLSVRLDKSGKIERLNFAAMPVTISNKKFEVASDNKLRTSMDLAVERLVRPYIQQENTSGLVLAIIDRNKISRYSYGTVDKNIQQLPDADQTIFEIGSVTKTFNALLLARQVTEGTMKLTDPINKYLPDSISALSYQGQYIRLVHLANHTAGFPRLPENIFGGKVDPEDPYKHYNNELLFAYLAHYKASVAPGTKFSYSNLGAGLLGTIFERTGKQSFERLLIHDICQPLGMNNTKVSLNAGQLERFAQGYNEQGNATSPWDLASLKGSGAIRSTLNDMIRYAQAQLRPQGLLGKAIKLSQQETFADTKESIGLGWRINNMSRSRYFHHSGGTGGFRSFVGFDPTGQFAVVILSNAAVDVTGIGQEIMEK